MGYMEIIGGWFTQPAFSLPIDMNCIPIAIAIDLHDDNHTLINNIQASAPAKIISPQLTQTRISGLSSLFNTVL